MVTTDTEGPQRITSGVTKRANARGTQSVFACIDLLLTMTDVNQPQGAELQYATLPESLWATPEEWCPHSY